MAEMRDNVRVSGILLHPTSLPGPHGVGDLGDGAYRYVDWLARAKQRVWQILPLARVGFGNSPYAAHSAFAGNPLLVSLDRLADEGLLSREEMAGGPFADDMVDYDVVGPFKLGVLRRAYERFARSATPGMRSEFEAFRQREAGWLSDYALFMALKDAHGGAAWNQFELDLVTRQPEALHRARRELAEQISTIEFIQYQFFRQWGSVKQYANSRGVRIMGDIPIFVAYDSADVWANQELFYLDEKGNPTVVAGVPPDFFSETGQLWGNPLYRWDRLKATGYAWWVARLRQSLSMVDLVRIDHFRGFEAYWEVPASEKTAVRGRWVKGPGADLFTVVAKELGPLPIVVEDLGLITEEVINLREELGYPGMKVLQFAFGDTAQNPYLPHNYEKNCVVYTGTHDNDTTWGWYRTLPDWMKDRIRRYLARDDQDIVWDLIRLASSSVADMAIFPLQDVLNLGSEARMNFPGKAEGNWAWRVRSEQLTDDVAARLAELTLLYGRAEG